MNAAAVPIRPEARPGVYELHGAVIAEADVKALEAYAWRRELPRPFLYYLLTNDLARTVSRAEEALPHLPAYVSYLYRVLPLEAWGSKEAVEAWLNPRQPESAIPPRRFYREAS